MTPRREEGCSARGWGSDRRCIAFCCAEACNGSALLSHTVSEVLLNSEAQSQSCSDLLIPVASLCQRVPPSCSTSYTMSKVYSKDLPYAVEHTASCVQQVSACILPSVSPKGLCPFSPAPPKISSCTKRSVTCTQKPPASNY